MSPLDIHMLAASASVDGQKRGTLRLPLLTWAKDNCTLPRMKKTPTRQKQYVNLIGLQHLHFVVHIVCGSLFCIFLNLYVIIKFNVGFLFVTGGYSCDKIS